jgi:hypothetical protein
VAQSGRVEGKLTERATVGGDVEPWKGVVDTLNGLIESIARRYWKLNAWCGPFPEGDPAQRAMECRPPTSSRHVERPEPGRGRNLRLLGRNQRLVANCGHFFGRNGRQGREMSRVTVDVALAMRQMSAEPGFENRPLPLS